MALLVDSNGDYLVDSNGAYLTDSEGGTPPGGEAGDGYYPGVRGWRPARQAPDEPRHWQYLDGEQ